MKTAKAERDQIFNQLRDVVPNRLAHKDSDMHWYSWLQIDKEVQAIMQKYREFEQLRWMSYYLDLFHPDLLDDFMTVKDAIFDLQAPPLLMNLKRYKELKAQENEYDLLKN